MKKIREIFFATLFVFGFCAGSSFALDVDFSLGANLLAGGNFGAVRAGNFEKTYGETDSIPNLTGGFEIETQIDFNLADDKSFFVRPCADIIFNNGVGNGFKFTYEDHTIGTTNKSDCKISVTTLDIPLLFGYKQKFSSRISMDFYVGPYISFALSGNVEIQEKSYDAKFVSPVFGGMAGLDGEFKLGRGEIVCGAGYKFDFAATKAKINGTEGTLYARRNIFMSAGYRLYF